MDRNVCTKCENKLTDEELEKEMSLCAECQYRKDLSVPDNQLSLW